MLERTKETESMTRSHWEAGVFVPVLVLTARASWHEKVQGIDGGADDYVAKPFRMEELLAVVFKDAWSFQSYRLSQRAAFRRFPQARNPRSRGERKP
jgi:DNA-binding response OmpR family regulator